MGEGDVGVSEATLGELMTTGVGIKEWMSFRGNSDICLFLSPEYDTALGIEAFGWGDLDILVGVDGDDGWYW
jgi:hypothetical protein